MSALPLNCHVTVQMGLNLVLESCKYVSKKWLKIKFNGKKGKILDDFAN